MNMSAIAAMERWFELELLEESLEAVEEWVGAG